jgi:hypothetical protein
LGERRPQTSNREAQLVRAGEAALDGSYKAVGQTFSFGQWPILVPAPAADAVRPQLLLVLGEGGCSACEAAALRFVGRIADRVGNTRTTIVAVAKDPNYPRALIREAEVRTRLLFDERGDSTLWLHEKGIDGLPFLAVLNAQNGVILAHVPIPGQTAWTETFERAATKLMVN